jgi:hypothetical protein
MVVCKIFEHALLELVNDPTPMEVDSDAGCYSCQIYILLVYDDARNSQVVTILFYVHVNFNLVLIVMVNQCIFHIWYI